MDSKTYKSSHPGEEPIEVTRRASVTRPAPLSTKQSDTPVYSPRESVRMSPSLTPRWASSPTRSPKGFDRNAVFFPRGLNYKGDPEWLQHPNKDSTHLYIQPDSLSRAEKVLGPANVAETPGFITPNIHHYPPMHEGHFGKHDLIDHNPKSELPKVFGPGGAMESANFPLGGDVPSTHVVRTNFHKQKSHWYVDEPPRPYGVLRNNSEETKGVWYSAPTPPPAQSDKMTSSQSTAYGKTVRGG